MSKKVYIFLADGFEDIEGLTVVDLMRRAGITITTVSIKNTKQITTAHGITMLTDTTFREADFSDADMLVLPGGQPGTTYLGGSSHLPIWLKASIIMEVRSQPSARHLLFLQKSDFYMERRPLHTRPAWTVLEML